MATRPKTAEQVSPQRVQATLKARYNPIRNLTPSLLSTQLDSFAGGQISRCALTWDKIEERDDVLISVARKRKKAVARHGFEIITLDDSPQAARHKETLEYFYNNITATSAIDGNVRGGWSLLVRQMMDAVGKMYAVHEIIWEPRDRMTATFKFVPLWFFENESGKLRYLEKAAATKGTDLNPAEWIVTVGDGLMAACSVAYMYKHIPLKDWLIYSERHGMPGIRGVTNAKRGSAEWNDMVEAVENFATDFAAVMSSDEKIEAINVETRGQLPYPKLVERMDRAMAAIWRGADLSTMSSGSGEGTGASLQGEEADILEDDDAEMITEVLNEQVDRHVIRYVHGAPRALAYIRVKTGLRQKIDEDIKVDKFLIESGVPTAIKDILTRYGRPIPEPGQNLVRTPAASPSPQPSPGDSGPANSKLGNAAPAPRIDKAKALKARRINQQLAAGSRDSVARALADDMSALRRRLEIITQVEDPELRDAALSKLRSDLPGILEQINVNPGAARAIENALGAALINGYAESVEVRAA